MSRDVASSLSAHVEHMSTPAIAGRISGGEGEGVECKGGDKAADSQAVTSASAPRAAEGPILAAFARVRPVPGGAKADLQQVWEDVKMCGKVWTGYQNGTLADGIGNQLDDGLIRSNSVLIEPCPATLPVRSWEEGVGSPLTAPPSSMHHASSPPSSPHPSSVRLGRSGW